MKLTPVATRYTHDFVRAHLPRGARDILEIGCGTGQLAAALAADGLSVIAIDSDVDCVTDAVDRGVDARHVTWPAPLDRQFDCVLFTRSLHHVDDLQESLTAARRALQPDGRLIVEDFQAEGASRRSGEWYRGLVRTLSASGAFVESFDLDNQLDAAEPDHEHHLHPSSAIAEALQGLGNVKHEGAAYFFRYLEGQFREDGVSEEMLRYELSMIEVGAIDPLGRRFVVVD